MRKVLFIWCLVCELAVAQDLNSSKTYISTCYDKHQCFSLNNGSYIFFNTANSELMVVIDFNKFRIGNDSLDEWLDDLSDSKLIFNGQLGTKDLLELTHHNSKTNLINGITTFNGISRPMNVELTLFEIATNGLLFKDNGQPYFDRINANLQFSIVPKDFKIDKKPHHLKKVIRVAIYRGVFNEYKPEMNKWLPNN